MRACGIFSARVRNSSGEYTAPPPPTVCTLDTSYSAKPGCSTRRHSCVGTQLHPLTLYSCVSRRCVSSSHAPTGGSTMRLPTNAAIVNGRHPDTWKIGPVRIIVGCVPDDDAD